MDDKHSWVAYGYTVQFLRNLKRKVEKQAQMIL